MKKANTETFLFSSPPLLKKEVPFYIAVRISVNHLVDELLDVRTPTLFAKLNGKCLPAVFATIRERKAAKNIYDNIFFCSTFILWRQSTE
jgi:hypothetical protein